MKLNRIKHIVLLLGIMIAMSSTACAQYRKVQAQRGEGVTQLLQRNNLPPKRYESEFRALNKGKFTSDGGLMLGVTYRLPNLGEAISQSSAASSTKGRKPLFGKNYEHYSVTSHELDNTVFYLVSGHGGPDPGAIGTYNGNRLHEDEYAYDIILRLGRELLSRGAKVHFIIQDPKDGIRDEMVLKNSKNETCMGQAIPLDQRQRLQQRCDAINQLYKQDGGAYKRAVFIHVDSRSKGKQTDVFFYHMSGSVKGKQLAENIRRTFNRKYSVHQPNRGFKGSVSARNLYVLVNSTPPAVFLELGNIQNSRDQQRLVLSNNRQALAAWIADGIVTDYKNEKKK